MPSTVVLLPLLSLLSALIVLRMIRVGVLDHPGARSSHARPTPKGGGVGIVAATLVMLLAVGGSGLLPLGLAGLGIATLSWFDDLHDFPFVVKLAAQFVAAAIVAATLVMLLAVGGSGLLPLGLAGLGIATLSWFDDLHDFPFVVKLAAQFVAAAIATAGGLLITAPTLPIVGVVPLGWFGWPLTVLWLVAATNAVNFMDGLNGLAAGTVGLAALVLGGSSFGATPSSLVSLALAAGIAGFLPFNYPRARIFMGDVGSQFCGFMLAGLGLAATRAIPAIPILLVPMLLAGLLFDVVFTLARRALARDRLTEAHRSHLYQVAHRTGLPAWLITLVEWSFVPLGAAAAAMLQQPATASLIAALATLAAPQALWLGLVLRRAQAAGLRRW